MTAAPGTTVCTRPEDHSRYIIFKELKKNTPTPTIPFLFYIIVKHLTLIILLLLYVQNWNSHIIIL